MSAPRPSPGSATRLPCTPSSCYRAIADLLGAALAPVDAWPGQMANANT